MNFDPQDYDKNIRVGFEKMNMYVPKKKKRFKVVPMERNPYVNNDDHLYTNDDTDWYAIITVVFGVFCITTVVFMMIGIWSSKFIILTTGLCILTMLLTFVKTGYEYVNDKMNTWTIPNTLIWIFNSIIYLFKASNL